MADLSLDAYISRNKTNYTPQNRKPNYVNKNRNNPQMNRVQHAQGPRQNAGFDARQRLATKPQMDARQKLSVKKPAVVDARQKLNNNKQQIAVTNKIPDARQKIMEKTKFSDARMKIQLKKEKTVDARDKIKSRQIDGPNQQGIRVGTKMTASGMVVNIPSVFKTVSPGNDGLSRTVNNTVQPQRMQPITFNQTEGFSNMPLTRVINNNQQQQFGYPPNTLSSVQASSNSLRKTIQLTDAAGLEDLDLEEDMTAPLITSNFSITRPNTAPVSNFGQERPRISFGNDRYGQSEVMTSPDLRHHPALLANQQRGLTPLQQLQQQQQQQQQQLLGLTPITMRSSGMTSLNMRSTGMTSAPLRSPALAMNSAPPANIQVKRGRDSPEPTGNPPLRLYRAPEEIDEQIDHRTKITRLLTRPAAPPRPEKNTLDDELAVSGETMSPLQGFRVLIGNLHNNVTQEDITELFGAVGALRRARLVKPGTAEVVFVRCDDALNAVKKYHLRELDSLPMTVKFASGSLSQAAATKMSSQSSGPLRKQVRDGAKSNTDVIEASLIHKALFKGTSTRQVKPEGQHTTFTVRV